ncbi:hypothetical protein ACT6QG_12925 [Xanthobacter sp. TB0136]|uniref:hypothetical protein n=1 Tax=Xanthobacter sp. TB0136 TaxID=3459177 RepID=UPI004039DFD4
MRRFNLMLAAACIGSALTVSSAYADCQTDVTTLRDELEAKGKALQKATSAKQPDPVTLCPLFRSFAAAEAKWSQFLTENKDWCQIPDDAIKQAAASLKNTINMRNRVCQAAEAGPSSGGAASGPPAQGSISSALGITTGYSINPQVDRRGGVFDTLRGNALQ